MKKWELLHLTLDNSKSDEEQGDCEDQIKNVQDKESSSYQIWVLCRREQFIFWNVFRACMEFNFVSIQVIESQQC